MHIRAGRRIGFPRRHFGRHVFPGAHYLRDGRSVRADIVVVADADVAGPGVEQQVAVRDVAVALAAGMQGLGAARRQEGDAALGRQRRFRRPVAEHVVQVAEPARVDERHDVAEPRRVLRGH